MTTAHIKQFSKELKQEATYINLAYIEILLTHIKTSVIACIGLFGTSVLIKTDSLNRVLPLIALHFLISTYNALNKHVTETKQKELKPNN